MIILKVAHIGARATAIKVEKSTMSSSISS